MSLLGALQLGKSSLAAQQAGIQVTGNNIANAGTAGYTRQIARLTPNNPVEIQPGSFVGTGVGLAGIERQVNAALDESFRDATSNQNAATILDNYLGRLETTFGALSENDLSSRVASFFNSFSTLANNPADAAQRSVVIQGGVSLASYLKDLRSKVFGIRQDIEAQISAQATKADTLLKGVAQINQQITSAEAGGGQAGALRDQRDQLLNQLSELMDTRVIEQPNGVVNVLVGSVPVVQGDVTRGITTKQSYDATGSVVTTELVFADNGDPVPASTGKIGALVNARDTHITPALETVDNYAAALIQTVNAIHTQGQGTKGFSTVTGSVQVLDATVALNNTTTNGLAFSPTNGTFNLYIKDNTTGLITTKQINVNLSGVGTQTTLNSLVASINTAGGGNVAASVDAAGRLAIASNNSNVTFTFGEDTSGALASLGVNTFFTGKDALSIDVSSILKTNTDYLATARENIAGSNRNAQALALAGGVAVTGLGGKSLTDYYTNFIGGLAASARNAADDVTAQGVIRDTLFAQREAISGVSLDEEAINLTKYQRAFQGTARFLNVVDEMMQVVLGLVR